MTAGSLDCSSADEAEIPQQIPIHNYLFEIEVLEGSPPPNMSTKEFSVGQHIFTLMLSGKPRGVYMVPKIITDGAVSLKYRLQVFISPKDPPLVTHEIYRTFKKDALGWGRELKDWNTIESKLGPEKRLYLGLQIFDHPELRELIASRGNQRVLNLPVIPPPLNTFVTMHKKEGMPCSFWGPPTPGKARWYLREGQFEDFQGSSATDFVIISSDGIDLHVNQAVLAANNDFFAGLFKNQCEETSSRRMEAKDFTADVLRDLLSFIYTGVLAVDLENVDHILELWKASGA
ncbi:hypothetical protein M427DRAFT_28947 [Gonapodya prolifera JEL478]|uniref:BTB domain-containing protein n=1 Tax=Gonapodya prolifera (strain JEL478) TaxID=1344416 RepID=A0A139AS14_GONPJ|nr:hypothetical protein M427DRAFT_28947 [Gonapodya prolifera JEL478]|eukprot:KXS19499.1 hypothetical protein M427DRAFT_28947 [Gonapodya prolifera JEL478]